MRHQTITALVIVGLGLLYGIYDIFAYKTWSNKATISRVLLEANAASLFGMALAIVLAFTVGVLFGHLFLPQHVGK